MMRAAVLLLMAAALAGCGGSAFTWHVDSSRPVVDASLKTLCDPIPLLQKPAPMGALLEHDDTLIGLYAECAERNAAKAKYLESMEKGSNVD